MATRFIGSAVIAVFYNGTRHGKDEYVGIVSPGNGPGYDWHFDSLYAPEAGFGTGIAYDSPEAYDRMARSAVSFGAYYTSHNRGHDVPSWAPSAAVADAIDHATSGSFDDEGRELVVTRRAPARVRS